MPVLPSLDGAQVVRAFERLGWSVARQRGSHIILIKYHDPVAKGTLRSLIRAAGLTVDEFVEAVE